MSEADIAVTDQRASWRLLGKLFVLMVLAAVLTAVLGMLLIHTPWLRGPIFIVLLLLGATLSATWMVGSTSKLLAPSDTNALTMLSAAALPGSVSMLISFTFIPWMIAVMLTGVCLGMAAHLAQLGRRSDRSQS